MAEARGNPYSAAALAGLGAQHDAVRAFVTHWDRLETLVVDVYRRGVAGPADDGELDYLEAWLGRQYPAHAPALAPYWPGTQAGGVPVTADPFQSLLAVRPASAFVDNRRALATLPAAREALNRWLLGLG